MRERLRRGEASGLVHGLGGYLLGRMDPLETMALALRLRAFARRLEADAMAATRGPSGPTAGRPRGVCG